MQSSINLQDIQKTENYKDAVNKIQTVGNATGQKHSFLQQTEREEKRGGRRKEPLYEKKPKQHHPPAPWVPYFDPDPKNLKISNNQGNLNTYWLFYKHLL